MGISVLPKSVRLYSTFGGIRAGYLTGTEYVIDGDTIPTV